MRQSVGNLVDIRDESGQKSDRAIKQVSQSMTATKFEDCEKAVR